VLDDSTLSGLDCTKKELTIDQKAVDKVSDKPEIGANSQKVKSSRQSLVYGKPLGSRNLALYAYSPAIGNQLPLDMMGRKCRLK